MLKPGYSSAVNNEDALLLLLHIYDAPHTFSKNSIIEIASLPLTSCCVESEAVCGVWFAFPPSTAHRKLLFFGLCGCDERTKSIAGFRQARGCAVLKPKCFDGAKLLSFCVFSTDNKKTRCRRRFLTCSCKIERSDVQIWSNLPSRGGAEILNPPHEAIPPLSLMVLVIQFRKAATLVYMS